MRATSLECHIKLLNQDVSTNIFINKINSTSASVYCTKAILRLSVHIEYKIETYCPLLKGFL